MTATDTATPVSAVEATVQKQASLLPLLLIALPGAIAFAGVPHLVGLVFAAFCLVAWKYGCLKSFLLTLGIAFALNLCVLSGFAVYSDIDNYLGPATRLLTLPPTLTPDGYYSEAHLSLPQGFNAWSAALYRLTGWLDTGNALIFILLPATWITLRRQLSKLQTTLLIVAPLTFTSIFCSMPDGCIYLLLLTALFALRERQFWLPLIAITLASTFKTTAWIPSLLIGLVLLRDHPRNILKLLGFALLTALCVLPTLRLLFTGGLSNISWDFVEMNDAAREMGYFARLAYAYVGHWTTSAQPQFNVPTGGIDGGGMDGLGAIFRCVIFASLLLIIFQRKYFKGWWETLLIVWGSVLVLPTMYIGYARYVPLLYLAGMLPLVVRLPKVALLPAILICAMPFAWTGWRVMLATEALTVRQHAEAVHSHLYNIRAAYRDQLVETPQAILSGSLGYTYAEIDFPQMPRSLQEENRLVPASEKARKMAGYATCEWLSWALCHLPQLLCDTVKDRCATFFTFPRGANDGVPPPTTR